MSTWNYRVVRTKNDGLDLLEDEKYSYEIHEVYYDDNGKVSAYSEMPMSPYGSNLNNLQDMLQKMRDATLKPILEPHHSEKTGWTLVPVVDND